MLQKKNKGISLIVLIITIVVIIILAAAIILNLSNTNLIENANEAVLKSKAKSLEEAINLWQMENLMNNAIDKTKVKSLVEMLDELENQKLITADEREKIEITGKIEIAGKTIELTNVLEIGTKADLEKFRDDVDNGNTYKNKIVKLTANIDLQGDASDETTWWNPIGSYENNINFEGIFDGNDYSVTGIYNEEKGNVEYNAFFSRINNAEIKNLTVDGALIAYEKNSDADNPTAAGIVGVATGKSKVENCINKISIKKKSVAREVAGIVGCVADNSELVVINCINKGDIEGSNAGAGIVATAYGKLTIKDCYNEGIIKNDGLVSAGILARDSGECGPITITNSYNKGKIYSGSNASNGSVGGGIVGGFGAAGNLTIENCYNEGEIIGDIQSTSWSYLGGIVGRAYVNGENFKLVNSYNIGNISLANTNGKVIVGGLVGETSSKNTNVINCYNLGNLDGDNYTCGLVGSVYMTDSNVINLKVSNSFNAGSVTGKKNIAAIARIGSTDATIEFENTYYLDTSANKALYNYVSEDILDLTETYIKSEEFVKQLNNNIKQITEKGLKEWKYNANSYPTFK